MPMSTMSAASRATTDPGGQRLPLHILHGNEVDSVGLANFVDVRDIGVLEG